MGITKVTRWETSDGLTHFCEQSAEEHEEQLVQVAEATEMFKDGKSVGSILESFSREVPDEILYKVTQDTSLVVGHWQCRNTPGYKPLRFTRGLRSMHVWGDVDSWSCSYGGEVPLSDLVRYARDKNTLLEGE